MSCYKTTTDGRLVNASNSSNEGSAGSQPSTSPLVTNNYLNGEPFKYQVFFWNNDGRTTKLLPGAIEELVLEDNICWWYHSGHVLFRNTKDCFERASLKYIAGEPIDLAPYRFRNDGRDYIFIELDVPVEDDIQSTLSLNNHVFTIRMNFAVTQVEDVIGSDGQKLKKVYFWDYRQQLLAEKNICWSSPLALKRQSNTGIFKSLYLVDEPEASLYTGDCIKDIITETLKTPTTTPVFEDDFSKGGEKLFYTSPTDSKAYDDLAYVLSLHTHDTETMEPCLLRCDRFTDKWSLTPIGKYFRDAHTQSDEGPGFPGVRTRDRFYIADESDNRSDETSVFRNEHRTSPHHSALNNFWIPQNTINNYMFHDASSLDCIDVLNTSMVNLYNIRDKQFYVHMEGGDISNVRKYLKENMFSTLMGGEGGAEPSFILNNTKITNRTYKSFSTPVATKCREALEGRNRIIMDAILRGNTMEFSVPGMPSRQAGAFVAIDRRGGFQENEYDDKLLGYHLTVSVQHVIKKNTYTNNVLTVKPYRYKPAVFNDKID